MLHTESAMVLLGPLASVIVSFVALLVAVVHAVRKKDLVFLFGTLWAAGGIALAVFLIRRISWY
ncbi:MAG: hypothetical protein GXC76_00755 [Rhodanobacteraceae bacterium]|nr:hypothetical protein [Rhodanobacteraceae bacterium]